MGRFIIAIGVSILSVVAIAYSFTREIPVYSEDLGKDEFAFYDAVREPDLVFDATFSGVFKSEKSGRLITTYDRTAGVDGRPACPT